MADSASHSRCLLIDEAFRSASDSREDEQGAVLQRSAAHKLPKDLSQRGQRRMVNERFVDPLRVIR